MRLLIKRTPTNRIEYSGFTLVEMLVAVALVLLMMTMFAEIFTLATGAMSKQRGLGENDQRTRLVTIALKGDLRDRTFRVVFPYHPNEDPTLFYPNEVDRLSSPEFDKRRGYFYISENDPNNGLDDVLQLTIQRPTQDPPNYGKAKRLLNAASSPLEQRQPDFDDGDYSTSEGFRIGTSPAAEVSWFVRNQTLYRRVLLIRQPLVPSSTVGDDPEDQSGTPLITGYYPGGYVENGTTFLNDFDYSATCTRGAGGRPFFNGITSLNNIPSWSASTGRFLAVPLYRFGHRPDSGLPVEFLRVVGSTGPKTIFIGRYTQQETSAPAFDFPGQPGDGGNAWGDSNDTNPYTNPNLNDVNDDNVIDEYVSGQRFGEDVVLTNVHEFDIKVWDNTVSVGPDGKPGRAGVDDNHDGNVDNNAELGSPYSDDGDWRDIGHNSGIGDYAMSSRMNVNYGPWGNSSPGSNRCFDTWRRNVTGLPPFRPATYGRDQQPGVAGDGMPGGVGDDDGDGTDDNPEELGYPGSDDEAKPLKAIQIRIRFLDTSSNLMRDVTIVQSFEQLPLN